MDSYPKLDREKKCEARRLNNRVLDTPITTGTYGIPEHLIQPTLTDSDCHYSESMLNSNIIGPLILVLQK